MSATVASEAYVLHTLPGRVRVHLPWWTGKGKSAIETNLRQEPGIRSVQANPATGNVLIVFDPAVMSERDVMHEVGSLDPEKVHADETIMEHPPTLREKHGQTVRARIAVRGMDRDPDLARRVVEHLQRKYPGIRAKANPLTGRVLVEFTEHEEDLDDMIAEVTGMELPDLPGEDRPSHPLDPGPLIQSSTRTVGATLGLGLLAVRQFFGIVEPLPGANVAIQIASIIGALQGIPPIRYGLRRIFGRTIADLIVNVPGIVTLTLAGSPFGLALTEGESLRLLTETTARRNAWKRHEERIDKAPSAQPEATIRLEAGDRTPLAAEVLEGVGTAIGRDALPMPVVKGATIPAGARVYGGPFLLKLHSHETFQAFTPQPRPAPLLPTLYDRYARYSGLLSLIYAGATVILTRSFTRTLASLLLVNPRTAAIGLDSAELGASARMIRAGITVVGTRPNRSLRRPDMLLLDGTRLITDRLELSNAIPMGEDMESSEMIALAAGVAAAAGSPWGGVFRTASSIRAESGSFDGYSAKATIEGIAYSLGPVEDWGAIPEAGELRQRGNYILLLRNKRENRTLGILALRPRLAPGVTELVEMCKRSHIELAILSSGDQLASQNVARRANIRLLDDDDAVAAIRARQQQGAFVTFVSDNAGAAAAFAACDMAIGLTDDRSRLPARADLLAPDLIAVSAYIDAGVRRETTVRDSIGLSVIANITGALWGLRGAPGIELAGRVVHITSLSALADGWLRLRGGERGSMSISRLVDPHPERWGQRSIEQVLHTLQTSENGLSTAQAEQRWHQFTPHHQRSRFLMSLLEQVRSPLIGILAAGAGLSLLFGATGDVVIICGTIVANVLVGAWQENRANRVSESLQQLGTSEAHVLRDGRVQLISSNRVVPGDLLVLSHGDRVAADARVVSSDGLEVDEAALTGESLPVSKTPDGQSDTSRVVLAGSDVTSGNGRAIVVAVGSQTRIGATAEALSTDELEASPLGVRLSRMLGVILPLTFAGGAAVIVSGLLWRRPLVSQLATGATIALAGVPEGLPLLARVGEAGVARRLSNRGALVRRLSAVEALGRVDIACADKTGTMTQGHLALSLVASIDQEAKLPDPASLPDNLRHVVLTAALASPHPDGPGSDAHPTDVAVIQGAEEAGLGEQLRVRHEAELSFDPVRSFHATVAEHRLCLKGAPEALLPCCSQVMRQGTPRPLDEETRQRLGQRARDLAGRGLRVLMVADGDGSISLDNPQGLTALGFIGISDPLRPSVRAAVERCRAAGVRVIMITGDHPATARAIAQEAGLLESGGEVITATEVAGLQNGELDERLEHAAVIARATPLDKLRIIESLQRHGHTVAMTGDGVNDAPALRLADVGVAMGRGSTEVARQTADVVLADNNFSTLVETLVEGRGFWRNIRRALGLLLGGNMGELGLVVSANLFGGISPLTASQILAMNAITDILPAFAVALQPPEHRNLAQLSREGTSALDQPLRSEIFRRGLSTTLPSLISYFIMLGASSLPQARSVAFASIIATQLAQTLDAGRSEGTLTPSVLGAVAGSTSVLLAAFAIPPLRSFLSLAVPPPLGLALVGGGTLVAVIMNRVLAAAPGWFQSEQTPRVATPAPKVLPA
jgi:cation-transporting ATPase I